MLRVEKTNKKVNQKKFFLKMQEALENFKLDLNVRKYQKMMKKRNIYSLTNTEEFNDAYKRCLPQYKKTIFEIYSEQDMITPMSIEVGEYIESLIKNPDFYLGVHRSDAIIGDDLLNDSTLQKVFSQGLKVLGDASSGYVHNDADPNKSMSFSGHSLIATMINIKNRYKNSTSAILAQFPKEFVDEDGALLPGMENQVYDYGENGNLYIKPEFLIAALNQTNQKLCEIYSKEEINKFINRL